MAASASARKSSFSHTLQIITETKLDELEKQRRSHQEHATVLNEVRNCDDVLRKVELLANAIKSWTGSGALNDSQTVGGKLHLPDLDFWLLQAKQDPSFSLSTAHGWVDALEEHIKHNSTRFDAATLFGRLLNEWLASGDSNGGFEEAKQTNASGDEDASDTSFVEVGRKELHEQKEKFNFIVFEDHPVDKRELVAYLEKLFQADEAKAGLEALRKDLKNFGHLLQRRPIFRGNVSNAIQGILLSGLMDEEKRDTLKAFQESPTAKDELASVLNMRMSKIKNWAWPKEGMPVEFRRHLNGKYRAFTDPEIIDAIFLHHIGVAWQVALKAALRRLYQSAAWTRRRHPPEVISRCRAQISAGNNSIQVQRDSMRYRDFFMSQLHDRADRPNFYDDNHNSNDRNPSNPAMTKRRLLHVMTTEAYLNTAVHGTHAMICSDLEWFGPSLPITSILTVLEFIGVSDDWGDFFKTFLSAPLQLPGESEPRIRKRGTPISYSLSAFCGEAILFMMDFAVNQRADGLFLYRMHDDLWLWDADVKKVADGWTEMKTYAALVGLKFNDKKTGAAYIGDPDPNTQRLPPTDVRWGFLKFDVAKSRFVIDQREVDRHVVEMRRQLAAAQSVFGWVKAYNNYMAFLFRNFGGVPANCFSQQHVLDMIGTLGRIQRELFPEEGGAVGYLKKTLAVRFGITDFPEGYFYFPISSGGLELRNTMLELLVLERNGHPLATYNPKEDENLVHLPPLGMFQPLPGRVPWRPKPAYEEPAHESSESDGSSYYSSEGEEDAPMTENRFKQHILRDRLFYKQVKENWEVTAGTRNLRNTTTTSSGRDEFMSFEEYVSYRESWLSTWGDYYEEMLRSPQIRTITLVPRVQEMMQKSVGRLDWDSMNWYQRWIISIYGDGVVKKFGSLAVIDPNLIPIGMVELFKTSRMKLDQ
ncbi:unnamed protein product [Cyclocybe aegerita]|uniref:Reverse transcriptase domain-containing protein n=1 Tax=Cyclocybe aegerita TaxID=1973307 RepID=A0A8S0VUQ2_CYCAE|nr:unnamed protein product [Cyclocybe aegerita]